ncbi:unnamed protein product, partial [Linum tenue]
STRASFQIQTKAQSSAQQTSNPARPLLNPGDFLISPQVCKPESAQPYPSAQPTSNC